MLNRSISISAEGSDGVIGILQVQGTFETTISPSIEDLNPPPKNWNPYYFWGDAVLPGPDRMYDNSWTIDFTNCYQSYKRITLEIEQSRVHYVKLLSYDTAESGKISIEVIMSSWSLTVVSNFCVDEMLKHQEQNTLGNLKQN